MQFGDAAGDIIVQQVQEMVKINDALYASATSAALRARVDLWHSSALYWMNLADQVAASRDPQKLADWERVGVNIAQNAKAYADEIRNSSLSAMAWSFLVNFPAALKQVTIAFVRGTGEIAQEIARGAGKTAGEAGKGIGKTVLWIAGASALGIFLLNKAGANINLPFFSIGRKS